MKKIVLATSNTGKVTEYNLLLSTLDYEVIPQSEFNLSEVDETGLTFIENALLKARQASQLSGLPTLADDSGLCVPTLNGEPGIYSARYASTQKDDQANIEKVLKKLEDTPEEKRNAYFYCVVVLLRSFDDPVPMISQAKWNGSILEHPVGDSGFGYDPIFHVPTHNCSAAQLSLEEKNQISHRGKALQQLLSMLQETHEFI